MSRPTSYAGCTLGPAELCMFLEKKGIVLPFKVLREAGEKVTRYLGSCNLILKDGESL